jgi:hypothetical protein
VPGDWNGVLARVIGALNELCRTRSKPVSRLAEKKSEGSRLIPA